MNIQHIFIIGSKSIGQYGGYETFVDKLSEYHADLQGIKYHIACKANGDGHMEELKLSEVQITKKDEDGMVTEFTYHNAHVFKLKVPNIGAAVAVYYDIAALKYSITYCEEHKIKHPIFYILACRIGLFIGHYKKRIEKLQGKVYLNPGGHEWKRAKWSKPIRKYWKESEKLMVKHADLVVCDSLDIEKYIKSEYEVLHPNATLVAYESDTVPSMLTDDDKRFTNWLEQEGLRKKEYYLVVGRFVPENNYETMIREFMKSKSSRDFALITNVNDKFLSELEEKLGCSKEPGIKFVGTVYDAELLKKIRENVYGYFHGHEVGGTNPSLLEALGSTDLNLLLDVGFNREVGEDAVLYWSKEDGNLNDLMNRADRMSAAEIEEYGRRAKKRIRTAYSWQYISDKYQQLWMK